MCAHCARRAHAQAARETPAAQLPQPRATARVSIAVPTYGRPRIAIPRLSAVVKNLLIVLLVCYVTDLVLQRAVGFSLGNLLALTPGQPWVWQLVTYVFVDLNSPIGFMIGLLFVWWALSPFEIAYGPTRTLQLCLVDRARRRHSGVAVRLLDAFAGAVRIERAGLRGPRGADVAAARPADVVLRRHQHDRRASSCGCSSASAC